MKPIIAKNKKKKFESAFGILYFKGKNSFRNKKL